MNKDLENTINLHLQKILPQFGDMYNRGLIDGMNRIIEMIDSPDITIEDLKEAVRVFTNQQIKELMFQEYMDYSNYQQINVNTNNIENKCEECENCTCENKENNEVITKETKTE